MKFYCLYQDLYEGVQTRLDQLREASEKEGIEFIALQSTMTNATRLPILTKRDGLYNVARGSEWLETLLLNREVATFYRTNPDFIAINPDTIKYSIIHEKAGLVGPKTVYLPTSDRKLLGEYVDHIGGFPIVIKVGESTRGIGTIKVDSWHALVSTVDYLCSNGTPFILREFITAITGCRMIVLGNEVIAAADFLMNDGDFRNAVDLKQVKYVKREYSEALKQAAVQATHLCNVEFGGVDFLEDKNGRYYLLEMNSPTGFSGLIDVCGVDIPLKMVQYLKAKTQGVV